MPLDRDLHSPSVNTKSSGVVKWGLCAGTGTGAILNIKT
jgi:hypothetical protein